MSICTKSLVIFLNIPSQLERRVLKHTQTSRPWDGDKNKINSQFGLSRCIHASVPWLRMRTFWNKIESTCSSTHTLSRNHVSIYFQQPRQVDTRRRRVFQVKWLAGFNILKIFFYIKKWLCLSVKALNKIIQRIHNTIR